MKILTLIALFTILNISCSDEIISPPQEKYFGIQGQIIDTTGAPITGVKVYCLFDYGYIPDSTNQMFKGNKFPADSIFDNSLSQNFPNPLSRDTYLRFSLKEASEIDLTIKSKLNGNIIYRYNGNLPYGLFQRYLEFGINPEFKNGIYNYNLDIFPQVGEAIRLEKEMLIISNKNVPNSISDENGYYLFIHSEAFINDTIWECSLYNPDQVNSHVISNTICLQFMKEGYITKNVYVTLYKNVLLNQDIVFEEVIQ